MVLSEIHELDVLEAAARARSRDMLPQQESGVTKWRSEGRGHGYVVARRRVYGHLRAAAARARPLPRQPLVDQAPVRRPKQSVGIRAPGRGRRDPGARYHRHLFPKIHIHRTAADDLCIEY